MTEYFDIDLGALKNTWILFCRLLVFCVRETPLPRQYSVRLGPVMRAGDSGTLVKITNDEQNLLMSARMTK